ncbi:hypothetical protein [Streptomyces sp. NPDC091259]|uniref:hypothetical protein n=1 Tax=Streptomyces sp. NPDC091259 TaxID=3365976 RepID=UPI0037FF355F
MSRLLLAGATHRVTGAMRDFLPEAVNHIEKATPEPGQPLDGPCPGNAEYADRLVRYLVNTDEPDRVRQSAAVHRLLRRQALRTTWRQARRHAACHRRVPDRALPDEPVDTLDFVTASDPAGQAPPRRADTEVERNAPRRLAQ